MKKIIVFLPIVIAALVACSKSAGVAAPETAVSFMVDATNNSISLSDTYRIMVKLESAMPTKEGVTIETTVMDQTTNSAIAQNAAIVRTNTQNYLQLINLPQQHLCTVTVKVSSVATPSNSVSKSFTVVYK